VVVREEVLSEGPPRQRMFEHHVGPAGGAARSLLTLAIRNIRSIETLDESALEM
jgi:hypothetical protein